MPKTVMEIYKKHINSITIFGIILFAAILLMGRYDWSPDSYQFSLRGYLTSLYFLIILVFLIFHGLSFTAMKSKVVSLVSAGAGILLSIPYRWLGLEKFYFYRSKPYFYETETFSYYWAFNWRKDLDVGNPLKSLPISNWLPDAWGKLADFPNEFAFFLTIFVLGTLGLVFVFYVNKKKGIFKENKKTILIIFGLFIMILLQTYLHLSLRSPYVYITHYGRPAEQHQLYVNFMFPDFQGAVNADMFLFRDLEYHFQGIPLITDTHDIRRAFPFYLSSQLSYFIGTYRSFLGFNIIVWLLSCVSAYFVGKHWWNATIGIYMAYWVACGTGFIMYVAQPMVYFPGYASIIVLLFVFMSLFKNEREQNTMKFIIFGCTLGLGLLTYDLFPWILFYFLYGILRKLPWKKMVLSLGIAIAIYFGFLILHTQILHIDMNQSNSKFITDSIHNVYTMVTNLEIGKIYMMTLHYFGTYINHLAHAFFIIPIVIAMVGIFFIERENQIRKISFLLLIPSLIGFFFLFFGNTMFGEYSMSSFPRLNYPAYPAIFLLASGTLYEIRNFISKKINKHVAAFSIGVILLSVFVLNNIDAFGVFPQLYYFFYYSSGGFF